MGAPCRRVASVKRARVVVVAVDLLRPWLTFLVLVAQPRDRAHVPMVAARFARRSLVADGAVLFAVVVGALVSVVHEDWISPAPVRFREAVTELAAIVLRALVVIVAGDVLDEVRFLAEARGFDTFVGPAGVGWARFLPGQNAETLPVTLLDGAKVPVGVARLTFEAWKLLGTLARCRVALQFDARSVGGRFADLLALRYDLALTGLAGGLKEAGHSAYRAVGDRVVRAAFLRITRTGRAWVAVLARGSPSTRAVLLASRAFGAGVGIVTGGTDLRLVDAFAVEAVVLGTRVAVVTIRCTSTDRNVRLRRVLGNSSIGLFNPRVRGARIRIVRTSREAQDEASQ